MKILKKGTVPEIKYLGTCRNCKSELEADKGEVKFHYDQRNDGYYTADCPVCKATVYFGLKK